MFSLIWAFLQNVSLKVWKWIGIVGGAIVAFIYVFTSGKRAARRKIAENNAGLIQRQFEESVRGPKTKKELADSVEKEGL